MPSIAAITAPSAKTAEPGATTASRVPQKMLGRDDFMKLLAVQFQMQDPMKPMDDTAFIAQTAQFSALDQSTTMATELTQLRSDQQRVVANSYLGHHVSVDAGEGATATGNVTAIDNTSAQPRLVVGGQLYSLSDVLRVEPGIVPPTAPLTGN
jgi:flagellar basal-body rod modification protein FlgD